MAAQRKLDLPLEDLADVSAEREKFSEAPRRERESTNGRCISMLCESSSQLKPRDYDFNNLPMLVLICTDVHLLKLACFLELGDGCSSVRSAPARIAATSTTHSSCQASSCPEVSHTDRTARARIHRDRHDAKGRGRRRGCCSMRSGSTVGSEDTGKQIDQHGSCIDTAVGPSGGRTRVRVAGVSVGRFEQRCKFRRCTKKQESNYGAMIALQPCTGSSSD